MVGRQGTSGGIERQHVILWDVRWGGTGGGGGKPA